MKRNIKCVFFLSGIICSVLFMSAVFAIDWPADNGMILHNFGWNNEGTPALFHTFQSEGTIRSADSGEIIFINDNASAVTNIPSPLGSWMAVEQGDGLIGIYGRFKSREGEAVSNIVEQGAILAFSGLSGWSGQNGFCFTLYDSKEKRWVNPAMILPIMRDVRAPRVRQVILLGQDGMTVNPAAQRNLSQDRYKILVDAVDTLVTENENPLAPHRITCMVNGVEAGVMHMEAFAGQNGNLMAYRKVPILTEQVYSPFPFYEVGEVLLSRGQVVLEIIVSDVANNSQNVTYRLTVQ